MNTYKSKGNNLISFFKKGMGLPLAQAKPKTLPVQKGGAGNKERRVGRSGDPTRRPNSLKGTSVNELTMKINPVSLDQ